MPRIISALFFASVLIFGATCCKKKSTKKDPIEVDIYRSDTTTLPTAIPPLAISLDFTSPPMQIDTFATKVDEYITPYGFNKGQITKVVLKSLNIVLENSPGQTFNFVKNSPPSLSVYVDSFAGNTPQLVASIQNRPAGATTMTLDVQNKDIKDYFRSQYMKLLVGFKTEENEGLSSDTKFRVNYVFTVYADPNL